MPRAEEPKCGRNTYIDTNASQMHVTYLVLGLHYSPKTSMSSNCLRRTIYVHNLVKFSDCKCIRNPASSVLSPYASYVTAYCNEIHLPVVN